ncbi:MAG TPA: GAF domain-containing protein [Jatrophihabitantaceae bacterium]|jgi:signal transduction histidine kinase|nr:GAF domain-containing protein [Jatrophihabitantaceae bacterium]
MDAQAGNSLSFPDGPKLELDELIDQLVARARGVQRAQGRLRGLLRATEMVTGELSLETVLRHIVDAACALAGARYGALGVIAADGGLEQFIYAGIDDELAEQIGHLPEGKGLLGAVISDPHPIRLAHMTDDARSAGFPPNHPPMESFLGVPVRVRGEVFGNLYLTEGQSGGFTDEDEELVRSLAVTAGTAISNARLYRESTLQQRWLGASVEIGAQLLAPTGEDPLHMIARRASEIAEADLVTVALLVSETAEVLVEIAVGDGADTLLGQRAPCDETLEGKAIEDKAPLLMRSATDLAGRSSHLESILEPGPVMVIPLVGTGKVLGALTIARRVGRHAFSPADLNMAAGFASHANIAIELAAARSDQQRMILLEDRDRIARDLHDHVIQQLFAIGLSLEGIAATAGLREASAQKLHQRVADIDRTIRQIRTSIFELRGPLGGAADGFRVRILGITSDVAVALGFTPGVAFSGQVEKDISAELSDDVAACIREALTNIAKHARATSATIDVAVDANEITVSVSDNGVGLAENHRVSGTANLQARAEQRQGSFAVFTRPGGGTELIWKAPLI